MRFAVTSDGTRLAAHRGAKAFCPGCGDRVQAKCGEIKAWHWAHLLGRVCDWDPGGETDWHLDWKNAAPPERQEVRIGQHRADIVSPAGVVIELQHSHLNGQRIAAREAEYRRMVWLFDAREARATEPRRLLFSTAREDESDLFRTALWKWSPSYTHQVTAPLFLDLDGEQLFWLARWHTQIMHEDGLRGYGWLVTAEWFRREVINGRGIPRKPRGLTALTAAHLARPADLEPDAPPAVLDWRHNRVGAPASCRLCAESALMRDGDGVPCHKVCAELEASDQRAAGASEAGAA